MIKRIILTVIAMPLLVALNGCAAKKDMKEKVVYQDNKVIPSKILKEAKKALSYYPELENVHIEFKFKDNIKKSFMQAQPQLSNLFKGKNKRRYNIYISSKFVIEEEEVSMEEVPSEVLIGWLGHELGHIMDYREKTAAGLIIFGLRYITSSNYIKEAERAADTFAVTHGMGDYILATKDFILNNSSLSDAYKERIARLYLSPEEIIVLVNKLEEDLEKAESGG
ncbi:hypothetical protein [Salinimicrobium soli]|uniref:hypothetical protein n=1 Tax=Salinimicrobium soli TaxID=1254399 RepID=UPI003AB0E070